MKKESKDVILNKVGAFISPHQKFLKLVPSLLNDSIFIDRIIKSLPYIHAGSDEKDSDCTIAFPYIINDTQIIIWISTDMDIFLFNNTDMRKHINSMKNNTIHKENFSIYKMNDIGLN